MAEPDYAAELEKLAQLKNQGILTEEEFEAKKKQILGIRQLPFARAGIHSRRHALAREQREVPDTADIGGLDVALAPGRDRGVAS